MVFVGEMMMSGIFQEIFIFSLFVKNIILPLHPHLGRGLEKRLAKVPEGHRKFFE